MTTEHYRCPHCGTVYDNELITRVHVTRAEDDQHANRNGLMPECTVEVVDDDGSVIDHRTRQPDAIDPSTLTRDDFPDELSSKRTDAVLVAAHHPDVTTRTELTDLIEKELADTDRDPPADWTVRRALDAFYHPHESSMPTDESFSEIPVLQQAIIIANLTLPEASIAEVADRVGCAASYPPQVMERRQYLADAFTDRQAEGETLAAIVRDELPATHLEELVDSGHLDDIPIDVESSGDRQATPDCDSETTATMSEELDSDWGSPTDEHGVMTASPPTPPTNGEGGDDSQSNRDTTEQTAPTASKNTSTDTGSETNANAGADAATTTVTHTAAVTLDAAADGGDGDATTEAEATANSSSSQDQPQQSSSPAGEAGERALNTESGYPTATVVRQLKKLKSNLEFFRTAVAPIEEPTSEKEMLINLTEQTEAQCEQIIKQVTEETDVRRS